MNKREKTLAEDGSSRNRLVIKLTEYEENRLLDCRYWYLDKKSGEFRPTRKGVMLTKSNYLSFKTVIETKHEEVMDWLGVGYVPEHVAKYAGEQEQCCQQAKHCMGDVHYVVKPLPNQKNFFSVNHHGGQEEVAINSLHPFGELINRMTKNGDDAQEMVKIVCNLIASFSRARERFDDSAATDPSILFDHLEFEWSDFLKTALGTN